MPIQPAPLSCSKPTPLSGVTGFFAADGKTLTSIGIQCAVSHSTVDDAYAAGLGARLDGRPNRDLNIGAIVALAPDLTAFTEMLQISETDDGRFAALQDVVRHYERHLKLGLTDEEKSDLIEYLKSI
ncbi:hypothetical protein EV130_101764 [Rhizobium azibense]|uniref:Cytochrome c domain-containing protein n=1 Tax=Rhizobium azibense TaxID=1136135 RepID=A0A4R3RAF4_9HYPH|nr:hypothetical protein EV130_101764 [Rhizobium azibense]